MEDESETHPPLGWWLVPRYGSMPLSFLASFTQILLYQRPEEGSILLVVGLQLEKTCIVRVLERLTAECGEFPAHARSKSRASGNRSQRQDIYGLLLEYLISVLRTAMKEDKFVSKKYFGKAQTESTLL